MATKLTERQQEILDLIRQTVARTGFPPTRAEIAQALGFRSPNAAEDHLKALARKGAIELTAGASRGIRLKDSAPAPGSAGPLATLSQLILPLVGRVLQAAPFSPPNTSNARSAWIPGCSPRLPITCSRFAA